MKPLFMLLAVLFATGYLFFTKLQQPTSLSLNPPFNFGKPTSSPSPKPITLLLTGDVMLGRSVMITSLDKNETKYPFLLVAEKLKESDITFINLENPIVTNCPRLNSGFTFCADPKMIEGLKHAGVDVVTLANNHTLNFGPQGLEETKRYLEQNGILYTGVSNLAKIKVGETTFGFLGFDKSQQTNPKLTEAEKQLILSSDSEVDVLVVAMHWGVEYKSIALPGVKSLATEILALGADVIAGNHPHWVQDYEYKGQKPIYYSLGNFIFDQMWSEETKKGMAVKLSFEGKQFIKDEFLPVYIKNLGQPMWVEK